MLPAFVIIVIAIAAVKGRQGFLAVCRLPFVGLFGSFAIAGNLVEVVVNAITVKRETTSTRSSKSAFGIREVKVIKNQKQPVLGLELFHYHPLSLSPIIVVYSEEKRLVFGQRRFRALSLIGL